MLANRLRRWSTIKRTYRCNPSCCQVLFPDGHLSKRGRLVLVVWTSPVAKVMENCRVVPRMGMNIWGSLVQVPSGTSTCRRMQKAVAVNTRLLRAKSKDCNYFTNKELQSLQCTKLFNGLEYEVLSMILSTIKYPWNHSIRVGHSPDVGLLPARYCHDCVESDIHSSV